MKTMKKLLCIVLSLTMVLGIFSIAASAVTGAENTEKINVKYEIEQVSGTPLYTAVENNVYKLTVYAKAKYGISNFQVPIHFDKTKFAIIMADDADIIGHNMYSYDGNHIDIGDDLVYLYDEATVFSDTSMLTSAGVSTTQLRSAAYVGLGNSNAAVLNHEVTLVDTSNTLIHDNWLGSLPATTGIAFLFLNNIGTGANKMAHFNAYNGQLVNDWVSMGSIYFIRLPGVTEEEAIGSVFGCYADDAYGLKGIWNTGGTASYLTASYVGKEPGFNVVSNATITKWSPAISKLPSQIRFNSLQSAPDVKDAEFDIRTRAQVSKADLAKVLGCDVANLETEIRNAGTNIRIGFVFQPSIGSFDLDKAKAAAIANTKQDGYTPRDNGYVGESGDNIVWTCLVRGADYYDEMTVLPYIIYDGNAYFLNGDPITCDFDKGYDYNYPSYAA